MSYGAIALQTMARSVAGLDDARARMIDHIAAVADRIAGATLFVEQYTGVPVRLVVLPEYLFTSYPKAIAVADFADRVAWDVDGVEYDTLGAVAQRRGVFLAVNAYERDRHFPGLYFQASTILAPSGEVVLRYRRLNSMFAPTPHDVWDKYLDIYGVDGVFPVAATAIGKLAAIASEEILYPEIARAHALRGAEVFVHSSSEIGGPRATPKMIAKQARAFENMAYVVSANTAGIDGEHSADGNSMIVDHKGQVLAEAGPGEAFTAFAPIDIDGLRAARRAPGMTNTLSRQRTALFMHGYAVETHQHANALIDADGKVMIPTRDQFRRTQDATIARLDKDGLI